MPLLDRLNKFKHLPVALIYQGVNVIGIEIANMLIEQGANVILIDDYNEANKRKILPLLANDLFSFLDKTGIEPLIQNLKKLDYVFFLEHLLSDGKRDVSTTEFLERSNILDKLLNLSAEKKAKFLLATSISVHQASEARKSAFLSSGKLDDFELAYNNIEVQRYAENLVWEYYKRSGLNVRIVRVAELLGEGIDIDKKTVLNDFLKAAIHGEKLKIAGDGLEIMYFVHLKDAAYGIIKALFLENTSGNVFSLMIPREITVLNLAYKILDLIPSAGGIDFVEKSKTDAEIVYKPANNLTKIGWKIKNDFEPALAETIDYANRKFLSNDDFLNQNDVHLAASEKEIKSEKLFSEISRRQNFKEKQKKLKDILGNVNSSAKKNSVLKSHQTVQFTSLKKERRKKSGLDIFFGIKNFLSTISIPLFTLYLFIFFILMTIYLFFVVPLVRSSYYFADSYLLSSRVVQDLKERNYSKANNEIVELEKNAGKIYDELERLDYLKSILFNSKDYDKLKNLFYSGSEILKASSTVLKSEIEIDQFFKQYEDKYSFKSVDSKIDPLYTFNFNELRENKAMFDYARNVLNSNSISFDSNFFEISFLDKKIFNYVNNLKFVDEFLFEKSEQIIVLSEILGIENQKTYMFVLVDEDKINFQGGEIIATAVVKINRGNIEYFQASDDFFGFVATKEEIAQFNLSISPLEPVSSLSFKDVSMVTDKQLFERLLKEFAKQKFNIIPESYVIINKNFLLNIGKANEININIDNLSSQIGIEEYLSSGNVNYANLLKQVILNLIWPKTEKMDEVFEQLIQSYEEKNIQTIKFDFSKDLNFNNEKTFQINFYQASLKNISIDLDARTEVSGKFINEYKITIKNQSKEDFKSNAIFIVNDKENIVFNDFEAKISNNKISAKILVEKGKEKSIIFKTEENIDLQKEKEYNINFIFNKPSGFSYNVRYVFDCQNRCVFTSIPDGAIELNEITKYVLVGMKKDLFLQYKLKVK